MTDTSKQSKPLTEAMIRKQLSALDDEIRARLVEYPHATFPAGLYPTLEGLTEQAPPDPTEASGAGEERFQLRVEVQDYLVRQHES